MKFLLRHLLPAIGMLFVPVVAVAQFTIQAIYFEGLLRHSSETALFYIPSGTVGSIAHKATIQEIVRSLHASKLFDAVEVYRKGENSLLIKVSERPTITEITLEGNDLIASEELLKLLKQQGVAKNRAFNRSLFELIRRELRAQYYDSGYYSVRISSRIEKLPRHRVRLKISIDEGREARITDINFTGNKAYTNSKLASLMYLSVFDKKDLFGNDKYRKSALEGSFEKIRNFYLNNGYARFNIHSSQISLSPDRTEVGVTLNVEEGEIYYFSGSSISGYEKVLSAAVVDSLNRVSDGERFSRKKILSTVSAIKDALSDKGYAFARVEPDISLDDENKRAFVTIRVVPESRVYVRRIDITGNYATLDSVVRREMLQYEGALFVPRKIKASERRINRLGYFSKVSVTHRRVSNSEVILIVSVDEGSTGSFNAQIGYSLTGRLSYGFSLTETNWLGRGYTVSFTARRDSAISFLSLSVTDPYFTPENVRLKNEFSYTETDANRLNLNSYLTNRVRFRTELGVPLGNNQRINYGFQVDYVDLICRTSFADCNTFDRNFPSGARSYSGIIGWVYDDRNKGVFPTAGGLHDLSLTAAVPGSDLELYRIRELSRWYFSLWSENSLVLRHQLGFTQRYDGRDVPFFERYFAGGPNSVRGYASNSLGEQYNTSATGAVGAVGGSLLIEGRAQVLIDPSTSDDVSQQNIRIGPFLDVGTVFLRPSDFDLAQVRASYGLSFLWLTPIGPISFNYAFPVNNRSGDRLEEFQFTLGQRF